MDIILIEEVASLGNPGDIVSVKPGYAMNFLLPQKLGVKKTPTSLKILEKQKDIFQKKIADKNQIYQVKLEKINKIEEVIIPIKASKEGRIFGSITSFLVQKHLKENHDLDLDKKNIVIKNPIRNIDMYDIDIVLNKEFKSTIKLNVTAME